MPIPRLFYPPGPKPTPAQTDFPFRPAPALSLKKSQLCCSSSSNVIVAPRVGTKRSRPGTTRTTPVHSHWSRDSCSACCRRTRSSSEDERDNSSDSDSDVESCCGDHHPAVPYVVFLESHRFGEARQPLLRLSRQKVKTFAENTRYAEPPDHQPSPRKHSRPRKRRSKSRHLPNNPESQSEQEHSDDGFVVLAPPKKREHFHFDCPLRKADPEKHPQCLLKHSLTRFENVLQHVKRHHMKPSYCPMCSRTFGTVIECDRHIMARTCELSDLRMPEGINVYQKNRLTEGDDRQLTNVERWERMYATIFPDAETLPSPFLDQGCGWAISIARDYWRQHGWRCVSDFLRSEGMLDKVQEDDERAEMALFKVTLEDLLSEIMREDEHI